MTLKNKTLFISGGSRGIGLAIALRAARDGANVVIAAKTTEPHPKLPGTIYSAAQEIEAAGGQALPLALDIRDDSAVAQAMQQAAQHFGGIDIVVNNASAIQLSNTEHTAMKRFDLMLGVNLRGTYTCTQAALPYLKEAAQQQRNSHVLTLSPPLNLQPHWFKDHVAYSIAKYGMSLCTLGHAEEFRALGIAVNSLWPRTIIATAALQMIPGVNPALGRKPEIVADAAHYILSADARLTTGNFFIDEEVLAAHGVTDLSRYAVTAGNTEFIEDFFIEPRL